MSKFEIQRIRQTTHRFSRTFPFTEFSPSECSPPYGVAVAVATLSYTLLCVDWLIQNIFHNYHIGLVRKHVRTVSHKVSSLELA